MRKDRRRRNTRLNKKRRKDIKKGRVGGRAKQWKSRRKKEKTSSKKMIHKPLAKTKQSKQIEIKEVWTK